MVTILLTVSRNEYLERVITSLELLECNPIETNILCIVDGSPELYVKTRNLIAGSKFNNRLTVMFDGKKLAKGTNIQARRQRITAIHNQARGLISDKSDYIFSVEDDTTFSPLTLVRLLKVVSQERAVGIVEGVEVGRWGTPYIGAWVADDIYEPTMLTSVENKAKQVKDLEVKYEPIDAGGLYCALIKAVLYKQHEFTCANGLGPDVNLGLEIRQLGFQNFIAWNVPCTHHTNIKGEEIKLTPADETTVIKLVKRNSSRWTSHS